MFPTLLTSFSPAGRIKAPRGPGLCGGFETSCFIVRDKAMFSFASGSGKTGFVLHIRKRKNAIAPEYVKFDMTFRGPIYSRAM